MRFEETLVSSARAQVLLRPVLLASCVTIMGALFNWARPAVTAIIGPVVSGSLARVIYSTATKLILRDAGRIPPEDPEDPSNPDSEGPPSLASDDEL